MRLNLGCGQRKLEGYNNVDRAEACNPDTLCTLGWDALPFEDGSVDEIRATHVLEHIDDLLFAMKEIYRVMKPGALMHVIVPHPNSDAFWGDPTHVRPITMNTLMLFSKAFCAMCREKDWANTPLADYLDVDFEIVENGMDLTPDWKAKGMSLSNLDYCIRHYSNVVNECRFVLKRV